MELSTYVRRNGHDFGIGQPFGADPFAAVRKAVVAASSGTIENLFLDRDWYEIPGLMFEQVSSPADSTRLGSLYSRKLPNDYAGRLVDAGMVQWGRDSRLQFNTWFPGIMGQPSRFRSYVNTCRSVNQVYAKIASAENCVDLWKAFRALSMSVFPTYNGVCTFRKRQYSTGEIVEGWENISIGDVPLIGLIQTRVLVLMLKEALFAAHVSGLTDEYAVEQVGRALKDYKNTALRTIGSTERVTYHYFYPSPNYAGAKRDWSHLSRFVDLQVSDVRDRYGVEERTVEIEVRLDGDAQSYIRKLVNDFNAFLLHPNVEKLGLRLADLSDPKQYLRLHPDHYDTTWNPFLVPTGKTKEGGVEFADSAENRAADFASKHAVTIASQLYSASALKKLPTVMESLTYHPGAVTTTGTEPKKSNLVGLAALAAGLVIAWTQFKG